MKTQRRMLIAIVCSFALMASVVGVAAQATQEKKTGHQDVFVHQGFGGEMGAFAFSGQGDNTFVFVSSEMSFDGKLVKGAPYSAQVVTESVQTLADGNRIVRRNTAAVYRDGEGRTRREQSINAVGAYASAGEPPQTIFINDPVAGVNYILDAKSRTGRKVDFSGVLTMKKSMAEGAKPREATEQQKAEALQKGEAIMKIELEHSVAGAKMMQHPPGMPFEHSFVTKIDSKNTKKESLGKQTIEGVEAEGTRLTTTIPAGEIGNEAPINIVSETWYSPELQTVIMSKHSDPRLGEHTYRLTNINRSEPAHSLFEVPSDYTVKEGGPSVQYRFNTEKGLKRQNSEKQSQ